MTENDHRGIQGESDDYETMIRAIKDTLEAADAVLVGAGAGLSTSAGFTYSGERFDRLFADFKAARGLRDMYSAGFYQFPTLEEKWAFWSRMIMCNRYEPAPKDTYQKLLKLIGGKEYFVLTTNVDHQFQLAGFDKKRLFYTQGDYGLIQCSVPCHEKTYDNEEMVRAMVEQQRNMRVPSELVPYCPKCGKPMSMNLRGDDTFVEDEGWYEANDRYRAFVEEHIEDKTVYLELGVGGNTPSIIKYPFWRYTNYNEDATYICINYGEAFAPKEIASRSICLNADIDAALVDLLK